MALQQYLAEVLAELLTMLAIMDTLYMDRPQETVLVVVHGQA